VPTRSHPRKRGPCSTLRRAGDSGRNPLWAGTVLARDYRPGVWPLRGL